MAAEEKLNIYDLKAFAGKCCIEIHHGILEQDIKSHPLAVQNAWLVGKDLILACCARPNT